MRRKYKTCCLSHLSFRAKHFDLVQGRLHEEPESIFACQNYGHAFQQVYYKFNFLNVVML